MANKATIQRICLNVTSIKILNGVDVVKLNFAKAFNSIVHTKLLTKIKCYGVHDMMLDRKKGLSCKPLSDYSHWCLFILTLRCP
jgi:hypothetical protein